MNSVPSRMLLRGGSVYSPESPSATAMLTVDGTVAWVGDDDTAATYVDTADILVDLQGRLLTPGFVDAHAHLGQTGFTLQSVNLSRTVSKAEALAELESLAGQHQGSVLYAQGWDETRWPEAHAITRSELDRAVGGKVAYVARVDCHSAVVSSALVARQPGITALDGWRDDGLVERDAHHAAREVTQDLWTANDRAEALLTSLRHAARQGITCLHDLSAPQLAPFEDFAIVRRLRKEHRLPAVVPYWGELMAEGVDPSKVAGLAGDLCADGAIGSRTACMHEPYADDATTGHLYIDSTQVRDHVVFCTERGLQAGFHVIGDRAVGEVIAGFRQAADKLGTDVIVAARHRLEHVEMPDPESIQTMAALGLVASVQPAFDAAWGGIGGMYELRLGAARARPMNPLGSMQRAGVVLALGSDSPVTPLDPWAGVRAAANHHNTDERLTIRTAFHAHTSGGHRACRKDSGGVLRPGADASYAVWDVHSPPADAPWLPDLHPDAELPTCVRTVVSGQTIFNAEDDQ